MNLLLCNFIKNISLSSANQPDTNRNSHYTDKDDEKNPRCKKCHCLLEKNRVLVYNRLDIPQQQSPRFIITNRCVNQHCVNFYHVARRLNAVEVAPSNTNSNETILIPVIILHTRLVENDAPDNRNSEDYIPPIEE